MAGIYIHVPFCKQACSYCNFYFVVNPSLKNLYLEGLQLQIQQNQNFFKKNEVNSIYLGGGSPSMLTADELTQIFSQLPKNKSAEITLEANPDDISLEKIEAWKALGVNRISLGVQSLNAQQLKWMNRAHNTEQALDALELIANNFENFSIDIMFGLPNQSTHQLRQDLEQLLNFYPTHLSAYALTVEDKTPLYYKIIKKRIRPLHDDEVAAQFEFVSDFLENNGFEHYEISNFAQNGARAIHNANYWNFTPYLGLGPGAHGFDGERRYSNVSNIKQYSQFLKNEKEPILVEAFSHINFYNELLLIRLRTKEGIDLEEFKRMVDYKLQAYFYESIKQNLHKNQYTLSEKNFKLPKSSWAISDHIIASLFYIEK